MHFLTHFFHVIIKVFTGDKFPGTYKCITHFVSFLEFFKVRKNCSFQQDFKTKAVKRDKRDKEGHYIMIKGSIQEEDMTITNLYAPNIGAPHYVRQMLTSIKGKLTVTQ